MITDDPGVVDLHKWELNTSINSTITNNVQLAIPYIDANYGIAPDLQLKAEAPYLFTFAGNKDVGTALGQVLLGLKIHLVDQSKHFMSIGLYPQLAVSGQQGFLFPVLFEKSIGRFLIGEDIGFFFGKDNYNAFQNGTLVGYNASKKLQLMAEYFFQVNYNTLIGTDGILNAGFRYLLTSTFTLIGSCGTQLTSISNQQKQYFISFLGLQSDF